MGVLDQLNGTSAPQQDGAAKTGGRFNLDNYVDVQTRINDFWAKYPDGSIITKLESMEEDFTTCRYSATVRKDRSSTLPDATGWAFEAATQKGVNKTSHEENCETSAIGRALANMGFATNAATRASRQEMEKVQRAEQESKPATPPQPDPREDKPASTRQKNFIRGLWKELGFVDSSKQHHDPVSLNNYCQEYWHTNLDSMSIVQASHLLENLQIAKENHDKGGTGLTEEIDQHTGEVYDLETAPF
jgi:hypothetical protein